MKYYFTTCFDDGSVCKVEKLFSNLIEDKFNLLTLSKGNNKQLIKLQIEITNEHNEPQTVWPFQKVISLATLMRFTFFDHPNFLLY